MRPANTDGEPLVLVEERFALRAPRAEVERRLATMEHFERSDPAARAVPSLEEQAALQAFKEAHYASWPDVPLPALGDKTPRLAVKTVGGRREVEAMLAELEGREHREPPGARFDVDAPRRALGLTTRAGPDPKRAATVPHRSPGARRHGPAHRPA